MGAAWFLGNLAEWAYITALMIAEYRRNGALAVGLVGARFVPGALLGPIVLSVFRHSSAPRLLRGLSLSRFVLVGGVAVAEGASAPLAVIVALVWMDAAAAAPYRPAQSSLIPALASTPQELSSVAGSVPASKALAQAAGALLGSLLLLALSPGRVVALADLGFLVTAGLIVGVRAFPALSLAPGSAPAGADERTGIRLGFQMIARTARPLLILGGARSLTRGLWTSLTVVASLKLLHMGGSGVGLLLAAAGIGAALAIPVSLRLAGRPKLAGPSALAFALAGLPIMLIGVLASTVPAVALVVIWALALALADAISNSLIHRVVEARVLAPSIAAIESAKLLLEGLGSLLAPTLLAVVGVRDALIIAGAPLPLLVLTSRRGLLGVDRQAQIRVRPLAAVLRTSSFRGMTMLSVETVAARLHSEVVRPRTAVVTQGESGDCFYMIDSGSVEVLIDGYRVAVIGPGGSFGEKALLRASPRSATVNTLEPTELWRLGAADFIAAVTGSEGPVAGAADATDAAGASTHSVEERLSAVPLFGAIDRRELARLGRRVNLPADQAIITEGDSGDAFYMLLEGRVVVTVGGVVIRDLQPGDSFGEIALLHPVQRTASVTTTEACSLWTLDRQTFLTVLGHGLPSDERSEPAGDLPGPGDLPVAAHLPGPGDLPGAGLLV